MRTAGQPRDSMRFIYNRAKIGCLLGHFVLYTGWLAPMKSCFHSTKGKKLSLDISMETLGSSTLDL